MMKRYALVLAAPFVLSLQQNADAQCTVTNATSCTCLNGTGSCELLPDIQISWYALQTYSSGPSEYSQTASGNAGRLRVSGSTPNQGRGPLEARGVNQQGYRTFICGTDTMSAYLPTDNNGYTCPNGFAAKQRLYQRIYSKNGNTMNYVDQLAGTMTYHPTHNHYHVDDWTTMTLRLEQPGVSDPRQWPIVASGGKLGFCLMDLSTCSNSPGHCRTSHLYNQGTSLSTTQFPNSGLGVGYGCGENFQGISVGKNDIYSESLDGMWINLLPGLCNGNYWIVADVDPLNAWREENEENNWTAIPFSLALQSAANSGGSAFMNASGRTVLAPGGSVVLSSAPGYSYLWNTGATTRSITVTTPGTYSCTVTAPCGSLATPSMVVTQISAPSAPAGTGATVVSGNTAQLSATGSNLRWFDAAVGGNEVGTGTTFTTPVLNQTTSYWAEGRTVSAGVNLSVGKPDNSGTGAYSDSKQYQLFDAYEPFVLESFKVYANGVGKRHFVLFDRVGNLIEEKYVELPNGMSTVTVNWRVPAGTQHRITAYDDNSDVYRQLWRSDGGVSYPYAIGTVGSITGSTGGSQFYYYLYDWKVRTDDVVAVGPRTQVTANVTNAIQLDLRVFLEGAYDGGTGLMRDNLRSASLIPSTEPFTAMGFTHVVGGGEALDPTLLAVTGPNAIVDWVLLELRSSTDPAQVLATRSALLCRNGQVIGAQGGLPQFGVAAGSYYVAVRHRNHFGAMTASAVTWGGTAPFVDLTAPATGTWGTDARKAANGVMVLWTGNARRDAVIKYTGTNNDRDDVLQAIGGVLPTAVLNGYHTTDVTMDGLVKYAGSANDRDPILVNIGGIVPTATRVEQLP